MSKILNFAGVSRVAGELKFRTATEPSRFQQLTKLGDTDVEMTKIAPALSKQAAAQELLDRNFANGRADIQALLESVAGKIAKPKRARTVRVKKFTVDNEKKLSIEEANARVMATMREITPEEAIKYLVRAQPKKRRSRKTQVEAA
jgi:hypothetical protein